MGLAVSWLWIRVAAMTDEQDKMLRQVAHDIRNRLHTTRLAVQFLKDARSDDSTFNDLCQSIEKDQSTAMALVADLVRIATEQNAGNGDGTALTTPAP
jgi:signal transduction histidine kinase